MTSALEMACREHLVQTQAHQRTAAAAERTEFNWILVRPCVCERWTGLDGWIGRLTGTQ